MAIRKVPNECYNLLKFSSKGESLSQKNWQDNFPKNHDTTFLGCIEQLMKTATPDPKIVKNVLRAGCVQHCVQNTALRHILSKKV